MWREVADQAVLGIPRKADRISFEVLVRLVIHSRCHPITESIASAIRNACAEFGMTPAARARMFIAPRAAPSKFEGLSGRKAS